MSRKEYRRLNAERLKASAKKYYLENREHLLEQSAIRWQKNKQQYKIRRKEHYEENKSLYLACSRTRKALILSRVPTWLSDYDLKEIRRVYLECKKKSEETGILHHVDHIVPLRGKLVSGLHVLWNLRIITAEENLRKGNKYVEDYSCASK